MGEGIEGFSEGFGFAVGVGLMVGVEVVVAVWVRGAGAVCVDDAV